MENSPKSPSSIQSRLHGLTSIGLLIVSCFSPNGLSQQPSIVFYCVWEFGAKVGTLAFNLSIPLLVNSLGNRAFGEGSGAIIYSYLSVISSIITAISFITFTSVMEYNRLKRKALVRFGYMCACGLLCFVFCFSAGSVYLASVLAIVCKVSQQISGLASDALLDAVAMDAHKTQLLLMNDAAGSRPASAPSDLEKQPATPESSIIAPPSPTEPIGTLSPGDIVHQINSRAYVTGYLGMISFLSLLAPILAIAYFPGKLGAFWVQGIIPIVLIGLWYLFFLIVVDYNLPPGLGQGPSPPKKSDSERLIIIERALSHKKLESFSSRASSSSKVDENTGSSGRGVEDNDKSSRATSTTSETSTWVQREGVELDQPSSSQHSHPNPPNRDSPTQLLSRTLNRSRGESLGLEEGCFKTVLALPETNHSHSTSHPPPNRVSPVLHSRKIMSSNSSEDSVDLSESRPINPAPATLRSSYDYGTPEVRATNDHPNVLTKEAMTLPELIIFGLKRGTAMQWDNVLSLHAFPDLSRFIVAWIFLSGAANTAYTVGAIIAYDIDIGTQDPVVYIIAGVFVGIISAIGGLMVFKFFLHKGFLTPKQILLINLGVIACVFVYILFVSTIGDFFAVALIAGSQIGSLGSFSKSMVSKLVPSAKQSRLFSLYQFSQEATGWIGPLIVASISAASAGKGNIAPKRAFLVSVVQVCLVELGVGVPLLLWCNVKRGEEARLAFDALGDSEFQISASEASEQPVVLVPAPTPGPRATRTGIEKNRSSIVPTPNVVSNKRDSIPPPSS